MNLAAAAIAPLTSTTDAAFTDAAFTDAAGTHGAVTNAADVSLPLLRSILRHRLTPQAARWLADALAEVADDPRAMLRRRFAEVGRRCGRTLLTDVAPAQAAGPDTRRAASAPDVASPPDTAPAAVLAAVPDDMPAAVPGAVPAVCLVWTVDDAVRTLLLAAAPAPATAWAHWVAELYAGGDAAERRGVLRALGSLGPPAPAHPEHPNAPNNPNNPNDPNVLNDLNEQGLALVTDALRTHDPRLVAAALGPYAARHLPTPRWRHGVLTCLHSGIPLRAVADLTRRADAELSRMAAAYVRERRSAGRTVRADALWLADPTPVTCHPPPLVPEC
ncbi:EboA domain-containing protein [Streptomyces zagrosensis]|uniref:Sugar phosphate isomerase n=1 Tax=Streptomyces zagrosensis TaxID=1042984 RepID=A0A7W9QGT8_9ACTN|nr:EboA domain-containing protein [Streptomyces zagrosensis]MBB5939744.1 hypothetical protein [Streptomyces zagrosensis]